VQIEFTAARDRAYARRLFWRTARRQIVVRGVLTVLFAVFGAATVTTGHPAAVASGLAWLCLAAFLGVDMFRAVPRTVNRLPQQWHEPRTYLVTSDRIELRGEHASSSFSWALIGRVEEEPFAFLLWQKGDQAVWDLPAAAMSEDQRAALREFVAARSGRASPKEEVVVTEAGTSRLRPPAPGGR
jgi:hypothetical protein